jgi:hypothetical protein
LSSQRREEAWERERERLLNRAMTKEWTTYTQMSASMQAGPPDSPGDDPIPGLSDEEEAERWAASLGHAIGNGAGFGYSDAAQVDPTLRGE